MHQAVEAQELNAPAQLFLLIWGRFADYALSVLCVPTTRPQFL